jgi:multisubunit Na+/H+ antiporter MnhB subunit
MKYLSPKYIGLITGAVMIVISIIMFYGFHFPDTGKVKSTCYTIYTIGIIVTLLLYKKNNTEAEKSFKDYFATGFKMFVVVVFMMAIFTFIFYKMNPQILENALIEINKFNVLNPNKTAAEVVENSNKLRNIFIPMTLLTNIILYLIIGALITLVGAGFLSQKKTT